MPVPRLLVRPPRLDEAGTIAALSVELGYPADAGDIRRRLDLLLPDDAQCVRVAISTDGSVVGWVHAARQLLMESGERCELLGLVAAEEARGAGVGRALVEAVEEWARSAGLPLVSLRCNVIRTQAHGFYEHLGYRNLKTQYAFRKALTTAAGATPMA